MDAAMVRFGTRYPMVSAVVRVYAKAINSRGFVAMMGLYLLRYRPIRVALRRSIVWSVTSFALCANFGIDLSPEERAKGVTIGLSRIITVAACYRIYQRAKRRDLVPFYMGATIRLLPLLNFFFFYGVYHGVCGVHKVLRPKEEHSTLPRSLDVSRIRQPPHRVAVAGMVIDDGVVGVDGGDDYDRCCICLMDDAPLDYVTHCQHSFHRVCLEQWVTMRPVCPICKADIPAHVELSTYLKAYFVLSFRGWCQRHRYMCGSWWSEPALPIG